MKGVIAKATREEIVYLELYTMVLALVIVLCLFVRHLIHVRTPKRRLDVAVGPGRLDSFRIYGSFALAVLTAVYVYAYGDNPSQAIPGLRSSSSLVCWSVASVLSLVMFAVLCQSEARRCTPEVAWLRVYWLVQFIAWTMVLVVRTDSMASKDSEGESLADSSPTDATVLFCFLYALLVLLAGSYGLFSAQSRFNQDEVRATKDILKRADPKYNEGGRLAGMTRTSVLNSANGYKKVEVHENSGGVGSDATNAQIENGLEATLLETGSSLQTQPRDRNPECFAGPLSIWYFNWMTDLVFLGFKRRDMGLKVEHLNRMHESDDPTHVNNLFRREWSRQKRDFPKHPSLFSALFRAYGRDYLIGAGFKFIYDSQQFVGPLLLQLLITFLDDRADPEKSAPLRSGIELVCLLALNAISQSIILHQYFHRAFRTGMRLKSATISAIYDKSLRIKPGAAPSRDIKKKNSTCLQVPSPWGMCVKKQRGGQTASAVEAIAVEDENEPKKKTSGEVVNLMTVDAQRLQDTMSYIAMLWSGIFQIALSLVYLFQLLGPAMFAGVAVMTLQIPITAKVTMISRRLQKNVMKVKDERVKVENEVLGGMKIIKLYAWERPYTEKINGIRERELHHLFKYKLLQVSLRVLWSIVPTLVSICSFATYTAMGHDLTAATAFTALALFNILRFPLATLPMAISNANEAGLSLERIREFLLSPEVRPLPPLHGQSTFDPYGSVVIESDNVTDSERLSRNPLMKSGMEEDTYMPPLSVSQSNILPMSKVRLELESAELVWDTGRPLLKDISFNVSDEELCIVVGATGSGKSGLLSAIIGELEPKAGLLKTRGSIAYVSQVAWIQNTSLRANILFGQPDPAPGSPEESRYYEVLDACALIDDLKILPDGELTEIGEKGINLSGGQKQRVAIARAVYADADIYLLDDCLSAVDSQVAHHIFERCITYLLKSKAVLFVTHNLQLVSQANKIVLLNGQETAPFVGDFDSFKTLDHPLARQACETSSGLGSRNNSDSNLANHIGSDMPKSKSREQLQLALDMASSRASKLPDSKQGMPGGKGDVKSSKVPGLKVPAKLIESESMEKGAVTTATYISYIRACGILLFVGGVFGGLVIYNLVVVTSSWWLGYWADHSDDDDDEGNDDDAFGFGFKKVNASNGLAVYIIISFLGIFIIFLALLSAAISGQRACRTFHQNMLEGIMRARMSFFDTTPTGRILNRFSNDVANIDEVLPVTLYSWLSTMVAVLVAIGTISLFLPWFLLACIPMGGIYYTIMQIYIPTSRELKRLDAILRSPIFSHFGETLEGASIIRAFRAERQFVDLSMAKLEKNLRSYYANVASNRWLAVRLEGIGTGFVVMAALLAVLSSGRGLSAGEGGLALTYALNITQVLNWFVRMSSDREAQIVAVERVVQYGAVESEASALVKDHEPAHDWPQEGSIKFENTAMRYRKGLPLVLKNLNREIKPQQKVGVVGRTGAGKSSLLLVLLRLVEPERNVGGRRARLIIDGMNILEMGLDHLRSRISIIPQDPVLFTGDVRFNLDPFNNHDDAAIWHALHRAHLATYIRTLKKGINHEVEESGRNFSVGQRQLLCLARALLRSSRILLLDEATSAVDHHTDKLVQETIKEEFRECTVLTIAHRLDTIIDYDRILVLSNGEVEEDDSPANLLSPAQYPNGIFKAMWEAHEAGEL